MTLVYGYNTQTVGNPFWADRPPRNQSRTDVAELNLYDGGHGDQAITKNEALQKIEETAYKVILLDLKIPEVRGLELLEAIREKGRDTAVIIITGYASIESAVETSRLGAMSYLHKPFTPDEIRDATENAFRLAA